MPVTIAIADQRTRVTDKSDSPPQKGFTTRVWREVRAIGLRTVRLAPRQPPSG
jgi:hypothetical protein